MSTPEIRDIYKKVVAQRQATSERVKAEVGKTIEGQLTAVFKKYWDLLQNPKIPVSEIDEAKRNMTRMLDTMLMDSDHDVIMALTNNLISEKYKEKLKNDS